MKRKIIALFAVFSIVLSLYGCSGIRNTFSLFGGNVEKTGKISHEFTEKNDVWRFDAEKNSVFFSSDGKIATVDENGNVRPVSSGTAVITAATPDGSKMRSVRVNVSLPESEEKNLRGVWVSTVWNIDFPSDSGLGEAALKKEIDGIVKNVKEWGLNAIFLQVRPMSDAIYPSEIFPSSSFVAGKQGEKLPFDILEYFVSAAHSSGISVHAWINPYRVSFPSLYGTDTEKLSETNPARRHPEYTVAFNGALYYNPGLPEVRKLVLSGVEEILDKYDVDGIHFDDYFYPSGSSGAGAFDDGKAFEKYGNGKTPGDWRRDNVTALIKETSALVKRKKPSCVFGVSPGGIWATKQNNAEGVSGLGNTSQTYYDVYADTKKWVEEKYVDYICPQIYWHIESKIAPFEPIAKWWSDLCTENKIPLYVGIAAYRGEENGAYKNPDEIKNELSCLSSLSGYSGEVYFSYSSLKNDLASVISTLKEVYGE